ncbi:unnamed protein product [Acanthoscelides obtectus]|uniref:Uncharacterized protein n=1 Tax=Acanthoscelides obtectus TaxID=200917 RepID=A0A9P0NZD9_ACAOB|nr:unnamed protein product [Acanthoscelides obtectus]CAK1632053.1 hypothetical protein AOBTE_LOCUS7332 [Acanthoscelides obtectus]
MNNSIFVKNVVFIQFSPS